jgi:hypothetical protein
MWNLGDNAVEVKGIEAEGKSARYSAGISQLIQVVASPRAVSVPGAGYNGDPAIYLQSPPCPITPSRVPALIFSLFPS